MAHGAGGKATQSMIEGLFVPAFGSRRSPRWATPARSMPGRAARVDDRLVRGQADALPRRVDRRPRRERPVDDSPCRAPPLALSLSLILEEGLAAEDLRAGGRRDRRAAEAAGVGSWPGHQGGRARRRGPDVRCTTGVGRRDPRATWPPTRSGPATASCSPARSASTARRSCSRAGSSSSTPRSSRTRARCGRCGRCSRRPAVAALHARRDPRRRGLRAERAGPRLVGGSMLVREAQCRSTPPWPARPRSWDRPDVRGERGQARRLRRRRPRSGARRAALGAGCERAAEIGEVRTEPPGMVLVETSFGGKRVMDQLVGDPLPRIC